MGPQPPLPEEVFLTGPTQPRCYNRGPYDPAVLGGGTAPELSPCPLLHIPEGMALSYKQGTVPFQSPIHSRSFPFSRCDPASVVTRQIRTLLQAREAHSHRTHPAKAVLVGKPWPSCRSHPAQEPLPGKGRRVRVEGTQGQRGGMVVPRPAGEAGQATWSQAKALLTCCPVSCWTESSTRVGSGDECP